MTTPWDLIATERRRLADELETLTDADWRTPSQCAAWTVEELAAHLILPFEVSTPRFMLTMARFRGDLSRVAVHLTARVHAANERHEVIAKLRANADNRWTPPRLGPEIPLGEIVVHGQDIRRPLGRDLTIPTSTVEAALDGVTDAEVRADYARRIGLAVEV